MRLQKLISLSSAVVLGALFLVSSASAPANAATCAQIEVISARGSGELNSVPEDQKYSLDTNYYGMGKFGYDVFLKTQALVPDQSIESYGVHYPAVAVANPIGLLDALHVDDLYLASVAIGNSDIQTELVRKDIDCPSERFIVIGYSQGAEAVTDAITAIAPALRQKIIAAIFFGNPRFNATDYLSDRSTYDSNYFGFQGAHNQGRPWYQVVDFPVFDYCHNFDPFCNLSTRSVVANQYLYIRAVSRIALHAAIPGNSSTSAHEDYDTAGDTLGAALDLQKLIASQPPL